MSFLKFWSSTSSSSKKQPKQTEKENSQPSGSPNGQQAAAVVGDEERAPPTSEGAQPFRGGRRDGRNLSISRSGRHKYRGKQRSSVINGELYATEAGASGAEPGPGSSAKSAGRGGGSGGGGGGSIKGAACREMETKKRLSSGMTSQTTAV